MEMSIKSKKLNLEITFSIPGAGYIFADLNGMPGTLGVQICEGGLTTGNTIHYKGNDEKRFNKICRNWYKNYIKKT